MVSSFLSYMPQFKYLQREWNSECSEILREQDPHFLLWGEYTILTFETGLLKMFGNSSNHLFINHYFGSELWAWSLAKWSEPKFTGHRITIYFKWCYVYKHMWNSQ